MGSIHLWEVFKEKGRELMRKLIVVKSKYENT